MRETLSYFLGAVKAENVRIAIVDRLQGDVVEATAASIDQLDRAADEHPRDLRDSLDGSAPWERFGVASSVRKSALIERPNAANLRALFYLEPVWNVRQGAVAAFRIRSVVLQEAADGELLPTGPEDLTPGCQLELALRRVAFAAELWDSCPGTPPALHLPAAHSALTHSSARTPFIARLAGLKEAGRQRLMILELTDVPTGLPALILSGLVTQLKPFCRGLLAHTGELGDVSGWRDTGLCGVVHLPSEARQAMDPLTRFAAAARDAGMAAACYDVGTHSQFMQAWAAGCSHLSGELISRTFGEPVVPQRFGARDLYAPS